VSEILVGGPVRAGRAGAASGAGEAVLELRDVFCVHRTREGDAAALQGLSLEARQGEQLCILGPSGAGKTTLLRVIAGLLPPSAGAVRVLGSDVGRLGPRARAKLRHDVIGFLGQRADVALPPDLSIGQAVALPLILRGAPHAARRARVRELLAAVGLIDRAGALPGELSGGERQRVALCAALAHRPGILLADEPTGELDEHAADAVRRLIAETCTAQGTTTLIVSHDPLTATRAERTLRMRDGRIVADEREGVAAIVVARGGWLQLPPELLAQAGISDRAEVEQAPGRLVLRPAASGAQETTSARTLGARVPATPFGRGPALRDAARVELRSLRRGRGRGPGRRLVLDGLSHTFAPGRMTVVTGRSGTGKTTLLRLLAGLDLADTGEVIVDEQLLGTLDGEQRAALRRTCIGYLPQEPSPVPFLSAEENVTLALSLRGWAAEAAAERASLVLTGLGLAERASQRVGRLSAGEAQRTALARALASARGLLIVDEPTSRLDEAGAASVAQLLAHAAANDAQTVICATHDPEVIRAADEVLALEA
jgi:ABC-type lipoprotein export system ATPase subunit